MLLTNDEWLVLHRGLDQITGWVFDGEAEKRISTTTVLTASIRDKLADAQEALEVQTATIQSLTEQLARCRQAAQA